jgi:hypothetical protein
MRGGGGQDPRVYNMIDRLSAIRMREKTGTGLHVWLEVAFQLYSFQWSLPITTAVRVI